MSLHHLTLALPTSSALLATRTIGRGVTLAFAFSCLTALLAQLSIPLPFSPVPITGQTLGVLLTGFALGARYGTLSIIFYLAEGAIGLPVFAGGVAGISAFFGPSAGYLLAFPIAAFLAGLAADRGWTQSGGKLLLAIIVSHLPIYLCGVAGLAIWMRVADPSQTLASLFALGILPFLPGDALKSLLMLAILPTAWRLSYHYRNKE